MGVSWKCVALRSMPVEHETERQRLQQWNIATPAKIERLCIFKVCIYAIIYVDTRVYSALVSLAKSCWVKLQTTNLTRFVGQSYCWIELFWRQQAAPHRLLIKLIWYRQVANASIMRLCSYPEVSAGEPAINSLISQICVCSRCSCSVSTISHMQQDWW